MDGLHEATGLQLAQDLQGVERQRGTCSMGPGGQRPHGWRYTLWGWGSEKLRNISLPEGSLQPQVPYVVHGF